MEQKWSRYAWPLAKKKEGERNKIKEKEKKENWITYMK